MDLVGEVNNIPLADRSNLDKIVGADATEDSYFRLSISNFGTEMLKNMGWYEGRGIGKNPTHALMNPVEFVPRNHRAGLGAVAKAAVIEVVNGKKVLKKPDLVAAPAADGKSRNYIDIGEKLHERKTKKLEVNGKVLIIKGKYTDMIGTVTYLDLDKQECLVELELNESIVKCGVKDVIVYDPEKHQNGNQTDELSDSKSGSENGTSKKDKDKKKKDKKRKSLKWIMPGIMVRVVSKSFRDGRYYDKKLEVTDILDGYTFVAMDERGHTIDDLREKDVETVMPKLNALVKVVSGDYKNSIGTLLERNKQKNQVHLQLVDTLEVVNCSQDDCAQYVDRRNM
jgi:G patch domain/KOW motif-containing protein